MAKLFGRLDIKFYLRFLSRRLVNLGKCSTEFSIVPFPNFVFFKNSFKSLELFYAALGFSVNFPSSESRAQPKPLDDYIGQAEAAIKNNQLKIAESLLEEAISTNKATKEVGIICVYDMLATLAFRQGDIEKAETILNEVIQQLKEKGLSSSDNTVVNYSLKLARIYSTMGRDAQAESGFRNCLTTQKRKYSNGARDEETALLFFNILFWYGKFLTFHKRYIEAKQCYESAYLLSAELKSIDSHQIMVILYHLGEVSFVSGLEDEALKYLTNGVILGRAINSKDLPSYYAKIGLVYFQKGLYGEAQNWAEKAKKSAMGIENKRVKKEVEDLLTKILKARRTHNVPKTEPAV